MKSIMRFFKNKNKDQNKDQNDYNFPQDKENIIEWLQKSNFDIISDQSYGKSFGIVRARKGSQIKLQLSTFEKFTNGDIAMFFAINIDSDVRTITNFKLNDQGQIEELADDNNQESIISLDQTSVETILFESSKQIKQSYERIRPYLEYFTLSGENASIEIGVKYQPNILIYSLIFVLSFLNYLEKQFSNIVTYSGVDQYRCVKCGRAITLEGDKCPYCGFTAPRCVICYGDPEPGEVLVQYDCCESYAHIDHAMNWKEVNDLCPHCKRPKPKFRKVSK